MKRAMNQLQVCLANNMKRYRKLRGFSQEKLAERSGASANYIALIECGKNFPSLPMIEHIAAALEVDEMDLFDKAGLEFQDSEVIRKWLLEQLVGAVNDAFDSMLGRHR